MSQLKPAHEVIIEKVLILCGNITAVKGLIAQGGVISSGRIVPVAELEDGMLQDIGGLCCLLGVLERMIIPEDQLSGLIEKLREAERGYRHAAISVARDNIVKRLVDQTAVTV